MKSCLALTENLPLNLGHEAQACAALLSAMEKKGAYETLAC